MKCRYCGHELPEGMLYCEACGQEVRIVPDYNPLEDMLTAQIKISINDEDGTASGDEYDMFTGEMPNRNTGTRAKSAKGAKRQTNSGRNTDPRRNTNPRNNANARRNTNPGRNTTGRMNAEKEQRRRQMERKKALKKKKRVKILIILAVVLIAAVTAGVLGYQNSYTGIVNKGFKAIESNEYDNAAVCFERAIKKKPEKRDAYTGLSKAYIGKNDLEQAESVFTDAIARQEDNADLYQASIQFFMDTEQKMKIPLLLEDAPDSVTEKISGFVIEEPEFSLDDNEMFDDVQELILKTEAKDIYYTTDGTEPDLNSTRYTEPIQLDEGETLITAIAVNDKGVPSLPAKRTYSVELPVVDAPAVSPSTGQYSEAVQIEIKVPDGYEAYYTMDRSDPTTASEKYSGPIEMPAGETIFKAVLVNAKGRTSGITTRNYLLEGE